MTFYKNALISPTAVCIRRFPKIGTMFYIFSPNATWWEAHSKCLTNATCILFHVLSPLTQYQMPNMKVRD